MILLRERINAAIRDYIVGSEYHVRCCEDAVLAVLLGTDPEEATNA